MSAQSRSVYRLIPMVDAATAHDDPPEPPLNDPPKPPLNDMQAIVAMLAAFAMAIYVACQWVIEARIGQ